MYLVDDQQLYELNVGAFARLARDDVPLLRRRHYDLGVIDLLSGQVSITGKLSYLDAITI